MYYLGIDLGGTNIAAGICDNDGKLLIKSSVMTKAHRCPDAIVRDMASLSRRLIKNLAIDCVEYVGIAAPGTADRDNGEIVYANNLPFLHYPIADKFREFSGIERVYVENDANAAAKGEYICGSAKNASVAVVITLGTGIGGGVIIDGKIFSGFNYAGAELGHMVIDLNGKKCSCGRKGCFEAYASATGLKNLTKDVMMRFPDSLMWNLSGTLDKVTARTSFDAMRMGDIAAKDTVDMYIRYLASGIVNIINLFQPEILSIGGGISNEKDFLLNPLKEIIEKEQYSRYGTKTTEIRIASLGNDAGIIGAAMLGI